MTALVIAVLALLLPLLLLIPSAAGVAIFAASLPLAMIKLDFLSDRGLSVSTVLLVAVVVRRAIERMHNEETEIWREPALVPFLVLVATALLGGGFAADTRATVVGIINWMVWIGVYWVVTDSIKSQRELRVVVWAVVISAVVVAAIGLREFLTATLTNPAGLQSTLGNKNAVGSYMAASIPLALALALNDDEIRARWLLWAGTALMGIVLAVSLSRGAWIAGVVASLFFIRMKKMWLAGAVVVILALVIGRGAILIRLGIPYGDPVQVEALTKLYRMSDESRIQIIRTGLDMFRERPLAGNGIGTFQVRTALQPIVANGVVFGPRATHNTYLGLLVENGIVGLAAFLAVIILLLVELVPAARGRRNDSLSLLGRGLLASFVALLVYAISADAFNTSHHWFIASLAIAGARLSQTQKIVAELE